MLGRVFGRLLVMSFAGTDSNRSKRWLCLCDCGKFTTVTSSNLMKGGIKSCGCLRRDLGRSMLRKGASFISVHADYAEIELLSHNETVTGFAVIDLADVCLVSSHRWHLQKTRRQCCYAKTNVSGKDTLLHDMLVNMPSRQVDHVDGDGLNNRRCNLRVCTPKQNAQNRHSALSSTGYKGVYPCGSKFVAKIRSGDKLRHLGVFITPESAAMAYNESAVSLFGEFACLNDIQQ